MFSYQMKLISLHPVGPASPFDLSLLHTHQPVPLPGDGGLQNITRQRERVKKARGIREGSLTTLKTEHIDFSMQNTIS